MYIYIKVTILTILIFASMVILSCSGNTSLDFNNKYLFTYIQRNNIRTIAKFNTETGSLSTICTDPLCSHTNSSDCKFKNYIAGHVSCKYIYFISTDDKGITYFNEYNYLHDSIRTYYTSLNTVNGIFFTEKYVYFCIKDEDEPDKYFNRCIVKLSDGEFKRYIEKIAFIPVSLFDKNYIYFADIDGITRMNHDMTEKVKLTDIATTTIHIGNDYIFFTPCNDVNSLYRVKIDHTETAEKIYSAETEVVYTVTDNYIFFLKKSTAPEIIFKTVNDMPNQEGIIYYDNFASEIYRMNFDGSNQSLYMICDSVHFNYFENNIGDKLILNCSGIADINGVQNYYFRYSFCVVNTQTNAYHEYLIYDGAL